MPITTPKVPDGLPELMRGLAKSVIKENPDNIYVHAAEYFESLIRQRDGDLDRGYKNFSAYKVYADYKQKCRGKGRGNGSFSAGSGGDIPSSPGGTAVRSKTASDGDDENGGSAAAIRGRRKKRVRKQGSKDSNKSMDKQESIGSSTDASNGAEEEKKPNSAEVSRQDSLGAIKEDAPDVDKIIKVEARLDTQLPRVKSVNKSVSVDSVAAANAVSTVLQDAAAEADEADRETGEAIETQVEADLAEESTHPINCEDIESYPPDDEEDSPVVCNGEYYGSAPSTAEVVGEVVGDADIPVNDSPLNGNGNADEVDLCIDNLEVKVEESATNGPEHPESESPVNISIQKQDSEEGEVQGNGIDTVDAEIVTSDGTVNTVEENGEAVPDLPDVPTDEPGIEAVETGHTEEMQPESNALDGNSLETNDPKVEDTVADASIKESSVDKVDEGPSESVATDDNKKESGASEEDEQVQESNKVNSVDEVKEANEDDSAQIVEQDSNNEENEVTSPKQLEADDISAPLKTESDSLQENGDASAANEDSVEKSVERDEPLPVSVEDSVVQESSEQDPQDQQDENNSADNGKPSLENELNEEPDNENGSEDVEKKAASDENLETVAVESDEKSGGDPLTKSESVEQHEPQPAGEEIPKESPEAQEVEPTLNGSAKASSEPSVENLESKENEDSDQPQSNGSAKASKEPSLENSESEQNADLDQPKSSGSGEAPIEPSLENPESEQNEDVDQPKSSGSAKASKEPSVEKPESEQNADMDQPKSNSSPEPSEEPPVENPESEQNEDLDQTKSSGSAKASKEPSLENLESEGSAGVNKPKSSDAAKASKEPSMDNPEPEETADLDQPKSNGSAKASKEPSIELALPEPDAIVDASEEPSLGDKSESELNQSLDQSNGDQSKDSSAKESAGESASGEVSNGSEKAEPANADEQEVPSEQAVSDDKNDEVAEETTGDGAEVEPSAPVMEEPTENDTDEKPKSDESKVEDDASKEGGNSDGETKQASEESDELKEEVVEEPCIQRQVSPSASKIPSKQPSVELDEISKVDLASFSKDSAEALFYTLKKSELENLKAHSGDENAAAKVESQEDNDDDADVVVTEEPPSPVSRQVTKRGFTDDFLENSPITVEGSNSASDGVVEAQGVADKNEEQAFNPMLAASVRNKQLQDQLHSRNLHENVDKLESSPRKSMIHRSMTERLDLSRQDTNYVDLRKYDPDYVEDEDQFDGYYIGSIKHKILASSVSVADSDYYDPQQAEGSLDDNHVQTALETFASTDTESTLPSQTTIHTNKGFLKRSSQNTSTNIPYSSFGNNAISQSLDEFIEREEQMKETEAQAASTIQRSYRRFRTNKKKLLRDYHSTMRTFTEDQSTESLEDYPSSVIQIKVDRKQPEESDNSFEDARMENRRRPMYSLNIDEYDTAARRMTLTRGVAMQRNSTPEDDSGKSDNASSEKKSVSDPASNRSITEESPISSDLSSEGKKGSTSSDEKENKDNSSSKSS
ncbi:dentin sialophosphoprotein isoform X2 [Armigeres subalbatus]